MRLLVNIIAFVFLVSVTSSCDRNRVFEENIAIPSKEWNVNNRIKFNVEVQDTVSPHDIFINIRITDSYSYSNLFTFLTLSYPNGLVKKDTMQFLLADDSGKWLGNNSGSLIENPILIHAKRRFGQTGTYTFELEQAMREENLPEISDVGLRIQKSN